MNAALLPFLAVAAGLPLLVGCGSSDEPGTSPFQGDGRIDIRGVVVAMRVEGELLREWIPEDLVAGLPSGIRADLFVLDEDVCGGPTAAVFRGADPALLSDALLELEWLVPEEGTRERFGLGSVLDPMSALRSMGGFPGRVARARERLDPRARPSVKQVVRGADLMLTPTVDLRDELWRLSDAMDRDLPRDTGLAVAIDGPQSARLIHREIVPAFRAAGALFDLLRASNPARGPVEEISAATIVRVVAAVLDGLEGAVLRPEGEAYRMTFDFEEGGATPIAAIFKARLGEWPVFVDGSAEISLSLDLAHATAFCAALEPEDGVASGAIDALDLAGSAFPLDGRVVAFWGPTASDAPDQDGEPDRLSVALGVRPGVADAQVLEWQKTSEHVLATWIRRLGGGEDVPVQVSAGWLWCGQVLSLGPPIEGDAFLRFRIAGTSGSARGTGEGRILAELRPDP